MHSLVVAAIAFGAAFGGVIVGMFLQGVIPESHLREESKEVIRLGTGVIATLSALVLGLLVGAAKSSFDANRSSVQQIALDFVLIDRSLANFGQDTKPAREQLRRTADTTVDSFWPDAGLPEIDDPRITLSGSALFESIGGLSPQDGSQRFLQTQALQFSIDIARERWRLKQKSDDTLPAPMLGVVAFWFFVLFSSFALFSPRNATTIGVLLICSLSVASGMFLIVDLDQPFDGLVKIHSSTLSDALPGLDQ